MVLVDTSSDFTTEKAQRELVQKLIGKDASITSITSMGKRQLAYPIRKKKEATYLVAIIEGILLSADIEKKTKLIDEVLRFLLTVQPQTKAVVGTGKE